MHKKINSANGFVFLSLILVFMGLSVIALEAARLYQTALANRQHKNAKLTNLFAANANIERAKAALLKAISSGATLPAKQKHVDHNSIIITEDETAKIPVNSKKTEIKKALALFLNNRATTQKLNRRSAVPKDENKKHLPIMSIKETALICGKPAERLSPYLSPAPGKGININTAPEKVISSLSQWIGPDTVRQIIKHRAQTPFSNAEELSGILLKSTFEEIESIIVYKSDTFSITSIVGEGSLTTGVRAFVKIKRGKKNELQELFRQPV